MYKVFIDGREGTTGLRIVERLQNRRDIELMLIPEELRKDPEQRKKYLNSCDIAFLCLPDAAAVEAVGMVENENVRIIDTSTAHRTTAFPSFITVLPMRCRPQKESLFPAVTPAASTRLSHHLPRQELSKKALLSPAFR